MYRDIINTGVVLQPLCCLIAAGVLQPILAHVHLNAVFVSFISILGLSTFYLSLTTCFSSYDVMRRMV